MNLFASSAPTVAFFLPNWVGDAVMATPAIRAVREKYPSARMLAIAKPIVLATFEGLPWFQETIAFDKSGPKERRFRSVVRRLRSARVDAAVLFPNSFRSALTAAMGRCRRRIGFVRYGRRLLLTDRFHAERLPGGKWKPTPIINDYNRLVEPFGIDRPGHRMELGLTDADRTAVDELWGEFGLNQAREVIVLNNSGAFGAAKLWPNDQFAELARRLVDRRGAHVLIVCGPNERDNARAIVARADRRNVRSAADRNVSIGLTKGCVARADLLITTDSGPRHFAAAFGRPVVSLFGPTHIEWTDTFYADGLNLQQPVPCGPCQLRVCPLDHRCMKELAVDRVESAATQLLDRRFGGHRHVG